MTKPLRQTMPTVAAFIDDLREAFGAQIINDSIRAGINGQPAFWARENGHEIGTRPTDPAHSVTGAALFAHRTKKEPHNG